MVIANNLKPSLQTENITKHPSTKKTMTPETSTKFGICGGQFIPEILMPAIEELTTGTGCCGDGFVAKRFEASMDGVHLYTIQSQLYLPLRGT